MCLDSTDLETFRAATDNLDEFSDAVTSYIQFCQDRVVPTCTRVIYNNKKPWLPGRLKQLRVEKAAALRSGERDGYKEAKYRFSREVRNAKLLYTERLQQQFSTSNGLRQLTNYKLRAHHTADDLQLANQTPPSLQTPSLHSIRAFHEVI